MDCPLLPLILFILLTIYAAALDPSVMEALAEAIREALIATFTARLLDGNN